MAQESQRPKDQIDAEDDYGWMDDDPFFNEELDSYLEATKCCSIGNIAARTGQLDPLVNEAADEVVYIDDDGREIVRIKCEAGE